MSHRAHRCEGMSAQMEPVFDRSSKVVVISGSDAETRHKKIERWLNKHYPGHQLIQTAKVKQNDRFYCRKTFRTSKGQVKAVYFDFTNSLNNKIGTTNRMFAGGTMIRIWARQGSQPTRTEHFT
ncbi:unnamed protein product [Adineta ricciae]|uniref:Uncharacterized protein n=1 Tax=Adineta ricciae TaxID=249248 RepID=A0A814HLM9_ADIRI|nr:unnamed protein product [Adineta ricciae]CAF1123111.1 unnamed protein product [Adineta ricciae]